MATKYCVAPTVKIESVKIELDEPCGPDGPEESCESCIVMCTQQRTMCAMLLGDLLDECARATRQDDLLDTYDADVPAVPGTEPEGSQCSEDKGLGVPAEAIAVPREGSQPHAALARVSGAVIAPHRFLPRRPRLTAGRRK